MAMLTIVRSSRVMNRPSTSTLSAAIGWLRMRVIGLSPWLGLLERQADQVDRHRDKDEEQAEADRGAPVAPAFDEGVRVPIFDLLAHSDSPCLTVLVAPALTLQLTTLGT